MNISFKKALVLAPHTDDAEFGCGGAIHRLIQEGCHVHYVAFSDCRTVLPDETPPDTLRKELNKSCETLGIESCDILDFEVRRFSEHRQAILQFLIDYKNQYIPDVVFVPSREDMHQDHQVITAEAIRAFKHTTILGYELPWNCLNLSSKVLINLTEENLDQKIAAIQCYQTQSHRPYFDEGYIRSLATTTGLRINRSYAEPFEPIRIIL